MKPGRFAKRSSSLAISRICRTPGKAARSNIRSTRSCCLCLLAMVAGAETITDIARFGRLKLALLRRFRPFEDGTPAHDHLGDILATLDTEAFERCFVAWVAAQTGVPAEVVAIDGKTVRRSGSKTSKKKKKDLEGPIHIVSAFAARQRLVLGQVKV